MASTGLIWQVTIFTSVIDSAALSNNWIVIDRTQSMSAAAELALEARILQCLPHMAGARPLCLLMWQAALAASQQRPVVLGPPLHGLLGGLGLDGLLLRRSLRLGRRGHDHASADGRRTVAKISLEVHGLLLLLLLGLLLGSRRRLLRRRWC